MTTLETIIKEEILPFYDNFIYYKRMIFKPPLTDMLSGFSFQPGRVYVWKFAMPLITPNDSIGATFGNRIIHRGYDLSDPADKAVFFNRNQNSDGR